MSRLYRLALRAFPSSHRTAYGAEMTDAFDRALAARRTLGRWSALTFVAAACLDALRAGLGERRRHARHGRRGSAGRPALGFIGRDLAHALRSLAKARGFSFVSIVSLGIGLGIVFALLMMLRVLIGAPPGFTRDGLVELLVIPQSDTWSYPDFEELRAVGTGMTLAGWAPGTGTIRTPNSVGVRVDAMYVTADYFPVLGVTLARGPGFTPAHVNAQPEVIVAHRLWRNRLGADPGIVGRTVIVNGTTHVVVGVTPEAFRGHLAQHRPGFEMFLPLAQHPLLTGKNSRRFDRSVDWVQILGRLAPETSLTQANAVVASIIFAERHPATNKSKAASVVPYYPTGARRRTDVIAEASVVVYAHVVAGGLALIAGPFQFWRGLRDRHRSVHRWIGRTYLAAVAIAGVSGLVMAPFSEAGFAGLFGFGALAVLWLASGWQAYRAIRRGDVPSHRAWMMRNFALTYAAVTLRMWIGVLITVQALPGGEFDFDAAFANAYAVVPFLSWLPNLLVAEWLIRRRGLPSFRLTTGTEAVSGSRG